MSRFVLSIFADYFQFYLEDDAAPPAEVDFSDAWTKETVELKLVATRRAVGVGTSRNMTVPVVIEIVSACPTMTLQPSWSPRPAWRSHRVAW
jgi:hypothetical protein